VNEEAVRTWFDVVHGGLDGWINLRMIHPDQKTPPRTFMVRTIEEAIDQCRQYDNTGMNVYCGLARRGESVDHNGWVDASEANLAACQVFWADLDNGTREQQEQAIREFPIKPTMTVDSGGGMHAIWRIEDPIECASDPDSNTRLRRILKGIQVVIGGDPAVTDAARIFRVAGTMNYPNARKRSNGRDARESSIVSRDPYTVVSEDFELFEDRGAAELKAGPREIHGHNERVPAPVEMILKKIPRLERVFYCKERMKGKSPSDEDFAIAAGLLKYAPWMKEEDVADALRYRRVALAHLVVGSEKTARYYAKTASSAKAAVDAETAAPEFEESPARWFQHTLIQAMTPRDRPQFMATDDTDREFPRIKTSVAELDTATGGGVYGFTVLAGNSGVGKSTLAYNIAMNAVADGWSVLFIAAEMDYTDYLMRAEKYWSTRAVGSRIPTLIQISDGLNVEHLIEAVACFPDDSTERLLVGIDSITKAATFCADENKPNSLFGALGMLTRLGEGAVRLGDRRVCVVATSEMNKDGAALGRRITYSSSLQVDMNSAPDIASRVKISIPKARYSAKCSEVGEFEQDWARHRLRGVGPFVETIEDIEEMPTDDDLFN